MDIVILLIFIALLIYAYRRIKSGKDDAKYTYKTESDRQKIIALRMKSWDLIGWGVVEGFLLVFLSVIIHYGFYRGQGGASLYGVMLFFAFPFYGISAFIHVYQLSFKDRAKAKKIMFVYHILVFTLACLSGFLTAVL